MRRSPKKLLPLLFCWAGSLTAACESGKNVAEMPAPASEVVARLGAKNVITIDDVQEALNRRETFFRTRYSVPEKKKEFLDSLVRFELLAQEALKKGFDNDPDLIRMHKQWLVARLVQKDFDPQFDPMAIPEGELRAYYESHQLELKIPAQAKALGILVKTEGVANKVAERARKLAKDDTAGFTELVSSYSEDAVGQRRGGDLGTLVQSGANSKVPQPVIDAVFALAAPGDVAGPIKAKDEFYIVRLVGKQAEAIPTFEETQGKIRERLNKERREKGMEQWVAKLKSESKVEVFDEKLVQVKVDTTSLPKPVDRPPIPQVGAEFFPGAQ